MIADTKAVATAAVTLDRNSEPSGDCVVWTGHRTPAGYGVMKIGRTSTGTHRVAYELWVGPIPEGLEIDHLCGNRACVRPQHLEAVTHRENLLRSTNRIMANATKKVCIRGHQLPDRPDDGDPRRRCKLCRQRKIECAKCGTPISQRNMGRHVRQCEGAK